MCSKCPLSVSSEDRTISTEQFRDSRPVYSTCTLAGVHFCPQLKQLHLFGVKLLHQNPFSLTRLPFLTEEKKQKNKTDSEPKSMKVESVYLKQCFKLLLLQSQVGKKNQTLFIILILENKLLSGLEDIKPLSLAALLVYEMFRLISKTHQFVKLHLQVLLLYIDTSVSTEGLVHVLGPLWWMSIWPEKLQWWKKK